MIVSEKSHYDQLKNEVTSFGISAILSKFGSKQTSMYVWVYMEFKGLVFLAHREPYPLTMGARSYAAYTAFELFNILPNIEYHLFRTDNAWHITLPKFGVSFYDSRISDCLGKIIIYLLGIGFIKNSQNIFETC